MKTPVIRDSIHSHIAYMKTHRRIVIDNIVSLSELLKHPDIEDDLELYEIPHHEHPYAESIEDGSQRKFYLHTHQKHYDDIINKINELKSVLDHANIIYTMMNLHAIPENDYQATTSQDIYATYLTALINSHMISKPSTPPPAVIQVTDQSYPNITSRQPILENILTKSPRIPSKKTPVYPNI